MSEMTDSTMCAHAMPFGAEFQSDGAVRFRQVAILYRGRRDPATVPQSGLRRLD